MKLISAAKNYINDVYNDNMSGFEFGTFTAGLYTAAVVFVAVVCHH